MTLDRDEAAEKSLRLCLPQPIYRRIILKITGEAFSQNGSFNRNFTEKILVEDLEGIYNLGIQIAIIVGGGNIVHGETLKATQNITKRTADYMGMFATIINALWLEDILTKREMKNRVQSAIEIKGIADIYNPQNAISRLEKGEIVILAAGTGTPYCTTDYAALLRSHELKAEAILKGTKVDGIYTSDPLKDKKSAKFIPEISYAEARKQKIGAIEILALDLALAGGVKKIPFHVFNIILKRGNLLKIICGEKIGSKIVP